MRKKCFVFLLFILIIIFSSPIFAYQHIIETYNTKHGLSDDIVTTIFLGSKGYIWVGTTKGLNRFDGKTFKSYSVNDGMINDNIRGITEDKKGNLWIASKGGLIKFDRKKFFNFTKKDGLCHNVLTAVVCDRNDDLIVGTKKGLTFFKNDTFKKYTSTKENEAQYDVSFIFLNDDNSAWICTTKGLLLLKDRKIISDFKGVKNVPSSANSIARDRNGVTYFGTRFKGGFSYENGVFKKINQLRNLNLSRKTNFKFKLDANKNIMITTWGEGIYVPDNGKYVRYSSRDNFLPNDTIWSQLVDNEGTIWVGTFGSGLYKLYQRRAKIYPRQKELKSKNVLYIFKDSRGNIWIGGIKSLSVIFKNKRIMQLNEGIQFNWITEDKKGITWCAGIYGLWYYRNNKLTLDPIVKKFPQKTITCIEITHKGKILISFTNGQLFIYDPVKKTLRLISKGKFFHSMKKEKQTGRVLLQGSGGLFSYVDDEGLKPFKFREAMKNVRDIRCFYYIDEDNYIIGADKLWVIENSTIKQFGEKDGLKAKKINSIARDTDGSIWLGTSDGLYVYNGSLFLNFDENSCNRNALLIDGNTIWTGSNMGVSIVERNKLNIVKTPSPTVINEVETQKKKYEYGSNLKLNYNENNFKFSFACLSFSHPKKNRFKYRLDGFDPPGKWTEAINGDFAIYNNLSHGKYVFKVLGSNSYGIRSSKPARVFIKITPPFWLTWWFLILLALHIIGLIYLLFRWRVKALKQKQAELEKIVQERTRDLNKANADLKEKNDQFVMELDMAHRVQHSLIPTEKTFPQRNEFCISSKYLAMTSVGGDIYDVIRIGRNIYGFFIADVSGHGVPAALITTMIKTEFNTHVRSNKNPDEICELVNFEISRLIGDMDYYLTAYLCILNLEDGVLTYTNAGHHPALLYRKLTGTIEELDTDGFIMGIEEDAKYCTGSIVLEKGDRVLMFTDGIIETRNQSGEFYEYEKLNEFIADNSNESAQKFVNHLIEDVDAFSEGRAVEDDRAILYFEFLNNAPKE
ncbi:MAG: SpoIIE family protein phosphatase [bacterium]|nr:SpoIIE family protein phosphatase [bacterium]